MNTVQHDTCTVIYKMTSGGNYQSCKYQQNIEMKSWLAKENLPINRVSEIQLNSYAGIIYNILLTK